LGAVEQRQRIDGVMLAQVLADLTSDGALQLAPPPMAQPAPPLPSFADQPPFGLRAPLPPQGGFPPLPRPTTFAPQAPVAAAPAPVAHLVAQGTSHVEAALAQRDVQIAELQQAVIELANQGDTSGLDGAESPHGAAIQALQERLGALESRLIEQDRTIRHTLTMLIEWIERDEAQRAAA